MNRLNRYLIVVTLLVMFIGYHQADAVADTKLNVVSTIGQINDIVKNIGGNDVNSIGLMGPGVDPHLYKASESDVRKISEADVIFYNGLFLEAKMEHIFDKIKLRKAVVGVAEIVPENLLLESVSYKNHFDPHVWFDVTLWILAAQEVRDALMKADPSNADNYKKRAEIYISELNELNVYVQSKTNELPEQNRILVTAHDAFRYFGHKYGFEVVGLQGISTESQAGAADVIRLAEFITEKKIKAIFIESSVPERNIQAVVEAVKSRGWSVKVGGELYSDAMGDEGSIEGTYKGMFRHNIDTIVDNLKE